MNKLLVLFAILLTSCSSLQFQFSTLNYAASRASLYSTQQPQILVTNTNLFSINAPTNNGWLYNSNYGNNWQHFDFFQYNNYFWQPNQYWMYPSYRWEYINRMYNIRPIVRSTYVRPRVQPVQNFREPRRENTRIVNPIPIRRNYNPVRTQPTPQIRRQSTPTRTRTMNTQPDVQRRPVQTRPQTRVTSSEIKKVDSNKKQ